MTKKSQKIIIYFILINFILNIPLSTSAQFPGFGFNEEVPVVDEKAIKLLARIADVLDALTTQTAYEFHKANLTLVRLLELQFRDMANKVGVDSLKEENLQEYLSDLETFIKKQKERVSSYEYNYTLEEAGTVGVYKFISDLPSYLNCVNPRIRDDLSYKIFAITQKYGLGYTALSILKEIPDCSDLETIEEPTGTVRTNQLPLLTKILQPFNFFNLAQISNQEDKIPTSTISITSAFIETKDRIVYTTLNVDLNLQIDSANKKELESRQNQIKDTWPIETCVKNIILPEDGGKYLCLEYKTLIDVADLEKTKNNFALSNPLEMSSADINIYKKFAQLQNVFTKTNIATLTLATSTDLAGNFPNEKEAAKLVDEMCANFKTGEGGFEITSAYLICVKKFLQILKKKAEIEKIKVESYQEITENGANNFNNLSQRIKRLKTELESANCDIAVSDLEIIDQEIEQLNNDYRLILNKIIPFQRDIENTIRQLERSYENIFRNINLILRDQYNANVRLFLFLRFFKTLIYQIIASLFGIDLEKTIIPDLLKDIEEERQGLKALIETTFRHQQNFLNASANLNKTTNEFKYMLYANNFNKGKTLADIYKTDLTAQKIEALERFVNRIKTENVKCYQFENEQTVFLKNKSMAREPINKSISKTSKIESAQNRSWDLVSLIERIFRPKLVEIRFNQ